MPYGVIPKGYEKRVKAHYAKKRKVVRRKTAAKGGLNKKEKRQVKKAIRGATEIKYGRFNSYDIRTVYNAEDMVALMSPVPLTGVQNIGRGASCYVLQTGTYYTPSAKALNLALNGGVIVPPVSEAAVQLMGGYSMERGDGNRKIDGNYAYANHHKLSLRICMTALRNQNQLEGNYMPTDFRVLYVRTKPHSETQTGSLSNGLFLSDFGSIQGLTTPSITAKYLHTDAIVNPGQFTKLWERRFTLINPQQPPPDLDTVGYVQTSENNAHRAYPVSKNLHITLDNPKKKLKFSDANSVDLNNYEPMNYNFTNYIIIIATSGCPGQNGTQYSQSWELQASGVSKFRDM